MPRNIEAFESLDLAITSKGRPFQRGEILVSSEHPDELVAYGLEREAQVNTTYPLYMSGRLSVRALMAIEGVSAPFGKVDEARAVPKWLFRSRLTFDVPHNRQKLEVGTHLVGAVSTLSADAPKILDDFNRATDEGYDEALDSVATSTYFHNLPGLANEFVNPAFEHYPRTIILRKWIRQAKGCMDMLSPTSEGQISTEELPHTIDWLLEDTAAS